MRKRILGILPLLLACFVVQTAQRAEAASPKFIFDATVRPFQCSGATATVVQIPDNSDGIVGTKSHNFISVTNSEEGGDAGFGITDIFGANHNENAILENSVEIYFINRRNLKKANVEVVMCFQPQLGDFRNIETISIPLADWEIRGGGGDLQFARKTIKEIWGNRPGLPNLRKMSVHMTGRGQIDFGIVLLRMEGNVVNIQSDLIMSPSTCDLFEKCQL
jgi:hypothetical protein